MNLKYDILSGAFLLLVTGGCFQSCQKEDFEGIINDRETLITRGQYLTARGTDAFALDYNKDPQPFPVSTPYRLLAFTKPYGSTEERATHPRFNKVAWEGELTDVMRYINIESEPDIWFGFTALGGETGDSDGLVSLDFYGFTYGETADHSSNYIELDGISGENTPPVSTLDDLNGLTRTETVSESGELKDLMRGELLNQNISTAGVDGVTEEGTQIPAPNTQSVLPFKHCFTKLRFQVSQQGDEDNQNTSSFKNLYIEDIVVTNTYGTGVVSLADGKVNVSSPMDRTLKFKEDFDGEVTVKNTDVGEILILPSDGESLSNTDIGDGYEVGLQIKVKSTEKKDIENMLKNTGSTGSDGTVTIETETDNKGVTWYKGTIKKDRIIDFYDVNSTTTPLYFKQNTTYMLVIAFKKDAVRIITVIPMIEEWLNGEGTSQDPWQHQALGQPQMFDNIVWNDRNLGAEHYDPSGDDFENTVGYFYQAGRNIPYYPYQFEKYDINNGKIPDLKDITKQNLANVSSSYNISKFRFYPIVDPRILRMTGDWYWVMDASNQEPQMKIPETKPDNAYYDFAKGHNNDDRFGLSDTQNMYWDQSPENHPVTGAWTIPSSKDFLTIFPSTPHAGNITFRKGWYNSNGMQWQGGAMDGENAPKVLRVTVPFYWDGMQNPYRNNSKKYTEAWFTLKNNNDPGYTSDGYRIGPGDSGNPNYEPDGDPEDGFASVYIISREGDDLVVPDILQKKDSQGKEWAIKSWGTIYAIKRIYTASAYRMRWRVVNATKDAVNPCFYVEICRYRCKPDAELTVDNYKTYDWDHPAATIYFPICGLGDWTGQYINFGTECQYATSDEIKDGFTSAVQIKVSGTDDFNSYIAVVKGVINRTFGMQVRSKARTGGGGGE